MTHTPKPGKLRRLPRVSAEGLRRGAVVLVVLYLLASNIWTQVHADEAQVKVEKATDDRDRTQRRAQSLADQVAEACAKGGQAAVELGPAACAEADTVREQPAPQDGRDGRGITGTQIADGRLLITYTDGVVEDKGPVVGKEGKAGEKGRGVAGSTITASGRLVLTYSDGATEDVGVVVGPEGKAGRDGINGRGVASVTVSPESHLIVAYDDGSSVDAGLLPPGPKGDPGRGIESVAFDFDTCTATVSYTDGTTEPAPMTGCEPAPTANPDPPPGGILPGN